MTGGYKKRTEDKIEIHIREPFWTIRWKAKLTERRFL